MLTQWVDLYSPSAKIILSLTPKKKIILRLVLVATLLLNYLPVLVPFRLHLCAHVLVYAVYWPYEIVIIMQTWCTTKKSKEKRTYGGVLFFNSRIKKKMFFANVIPFPLVCLWLVCSHYFWFHSNNQCINQHFITCNNFPSISVWLWRVSTSFLCSGVTIWRWFLLVLVSVYPRVFLSLLF